MPFSGVRNKNSNLNLELLQSQDYTAFEEGSLRSLPFAAIASFIIGTSSVVDATIVIADPYSLRGH